MHTHSTVQHARQHDGVVDVWRRAQCAASSLSWSGSQKSSQNSSSQHDDQTQSIGAVAARRALQIDEAVSCRMHAVVQHSLADALHLNFSADV